MKICFKCGINKRLSSFYKHAGMLDGHLNKCKDCTKKDVHQHRKNNIEYIKQYDRIRGSLPYRVELRKQYRKTEAYKISHEKACKKWRKNNPEKAIAHSRLHYALRAGKIKREKCRLCGNKKAHAHHENYNFPLDVKWLCAMCHRFRHKVENIKI